MLSTILGLLISVSILIFIHELGHFWAARWAGAKVSVFSIGFGKALIKWKDGKGTEWRIAWLPLGGFVRIYGQDDMFDRKKYNGLSPREKIGHYLSLSAWKQAIVIGAGVFMNLFLAWVIYAGLFMVPQAVQMPVIGGVEQKTNQLKPGDRVMQVNGTKINSWSDMQIARELNAGYESRLVVLRGKKLIQIKMPSGKWGVKPDTAKTEIVKYGFLGALGKATTELWTQSRLLFVVLGQMIAGDRSSKQLGGFISMADTIGKSLSAGVMATLSLLALLSVNLAVINLLPLPVLDGGFLAILLIEAITRRKMQGKTMDWLLRIGWGLIIALMVFTFWNDIARLIAK